MPADVSDQNIFAGQVAMLKCKSEFRNRKSNEQLVNDTVCLVDGTDLQISEYR